MRRCLLELERQGFIRRICYRPTNYPGRGTLPRACGLTAAGVQWILEEYSYADAKELSADHSPLTIEHELKRGRFHMKVVELCTKENLELYWRKTDLNHTVSPDDVFAIKSDGRIAYYFFELENKRKSFKELLLKYGRYERYHGTDECKKDWKDFRTFTVLTQMRSDESRRNIMKFLVGEPASFNGKRVVNSTPIRQSIFWFSTEAEPLCFLSTKSLDGPRFKLSSRCVSGPLY